METISSQRDRTMRGTLDLRIRCLLPGLTLAALVVMSARAFSAPPAGGPEREAAAPFDAARVQRLIAGIELGENARVLKYQYFLDKRPQPLGRSTGYSLLQTAFDASQSGTRRWFALGSVIAFAAFRLPDDTEREGYRTYAALVKSAPDAQRAGAEDVIQDALYDCVVTLTDPHVQSRPAFMVDGQALVESSAPAYLRMVASGHWHGEIPPWATVIHKLLDKQGIVEAVSPVLAEPGLKWTYELLCGAAVIYQYLDPDRAIDLFGRAKAMLPQENKEQVAWYYRSYVSMLWENGRTEDAVNVQEDLVAATGAGRGKLSVLCLCAGDIPRGERLLCNLREPTSDEGDVKEAASLLLALHAERPEAAVGYGSLCADLLTAYLNAKRARTYAVEMQARLWLAGYRAAHGDSSGARSLLAEAQLPPVPPSGDDGGYRAAVEQMRTTLGAPGG